MKKSIQGIMGLLIAGSLSACITTLAKGPNGGCANEDFVTQVSAGKECLALETELPTDHKLNRENLLLVITVHPDQSPSAWRYTKKFLPELNNMNAVLVHIKRPGYAGSTGFMEGFFGQFNTYENVEAVMIAIGRLKDHYKPIQIVAMGHSGGASTLASGIALHPQYAPNSLILSAGAFNVPKWTKKEGLTPTQPEKFSPHLVAQKTPKNLKISVITGSEDFNTTPDLAIEYVNILKKNGIDVEFHLAEGAKHMTVRRSPIFLQVVKKHLGIL